MNINEKTNMGKIEISWYMQAWTVATMMIKTVYIDMQVIAIFISTQYTSTRTILIFFLFAYFKSNWPDILSNLAQKS